MSTVSLQHLPIVSVQQRLTCRAFIFVTGSRYLHWTLKLCIGGCRLQLLRTTADTPKPLTCGPRILPGPPKNLGGQLGIKSQLSWSSTCLSYEAQKAVFFLHFTKFSVFVWLVNYPCKNMRDTAYKKPEAMCVLHSHYYTVQFMHLQKYLTLTLPLSLPTISYKGLENKREKNNKKNN